MGCQSIIFDRSKQTVFVWLELSSLISRSKHGENRESSFFFSYSFLFPLTFKIRFKSHTMASFDAIFASLSETLNYQHCYIFRKQHSTYSANRKHLGIFNILRLPQTSIPQYFFIYQRNLALCSQYEKHECEISIPLTHCKYSVHVPNRTLACIDYSF